MRVGKGGRGVQPQKREKEEQNYGGVRKRVQGGVIVRTSSSIPTLRQSGDSYGNVKGGKGVGKN